MVRVVSTMLSAMLSSSLAKEFVVPLTWVSEGRLTFQISVDVKGTSYKSISRVDLGSQMGLMLPSDSCRATGCGSSCVNDGCKCAPSDKLLMPADKCPDGRAPSGSSPYHHNGRTCITCAAHDTTVALGNSGSMQLRGKTLTEVLYMSKLESDCHSQASAKTGFNGNAPFTHAIYEQVGRKTLGFSIQSKQLTFGAAPPGAAAATVPWTSQLESQSNGTSQSTSGGGGRQVRIIAVNGKAVKNVVAAIDSGNGAFLTYGSGSPLSAAKSFPFSVTFEGGDTLTFHKAPKVNGKTTSASSYNHNVLSLGFMANFDLTFDDSAKLVYFAEARLDADALIV